METSNKNIWGCADNGAPPSPQIRIFDRWRKVRGIILYMWWYIKTNTIKSGSNNYFFKFFCILLQFLSITVEAYEGLWWLHMESRWIQMAPHGADMLFGQKFCWGVNSDRSVGGPASKNSKGQAYPTKWIHDVHACMQHSGVTKRQGAAMYQMKYGGCQFRFEF